MNHSTKQSVVAAPSPDQMVKDQPRALEVLEVQNPPVAKQQASMTGTLGKAMAVLDIVAASPTPPRFTDILSQCDQPRGTLHRQLTNLVEEGLLNQRSDSSYELGYKLLKFASRAWAANEFRTIAEPHLRALHQMTGETVHLGVLRDNQVIYLDKVEGNQAVRMYSQIGNASPVYCTGVGKAALSALSQTELMACLDAVTYKKFTEHTITSTKQMLGVLDEIRASGNAFDLEEHESGIMCVAAPVYSQYKKFVAGVSVTGPAYRVTLERLKSWAPIVRQTAQDIMEDMGARLGPRA